MVFGSDLSVYDMPIHVGLHFWRVCKDRIPSPGGNVAPCFPDTSRDLGEGKFLAAKTFVKRRSNDHSRTFCPKCNTQGRNTADGGHIEGFMDGTPVDLRDKSRAESQK